MGDLYDENGKWIGHILRKEADPKDCPSSVEQRCLDCSEDLEIEYGFCKYGLGSFYRCMECSKVYDFIVDDED